MVEHGNWFEVNLGLDKKTVV
jgi:hypothetical protein